MLRLLASFLFVIFTLLTTTEAYDLLVTSSNDQGVGLDFTPCSNDDDCKGFLHGVCNYPFCECNGTKFCEDKVLTIVTKIGETCKLDAECNIEHSMCKDNKCACQEHRVGSSDRKKCLTVADALGSTCEDSIQCYTKVPHSGCQNDRCVCQQQMHEYKGACYRDVALGGKCQGIGECSTTIFSNCTQEICTCKHGYVPNKANNRCLEIQRKISGPCYEDLQCSTVLGKAICKESYCQCAELYQFKAAKGTCVRDMLLGEICENHTDCHGPEQGESRSECILGKCKCRSEFYEEHGYCTSGGIATVHVPSILLLFVLLLSTYFYDNELFLWGALAYSIFYMFWITFLGRYFTDNNNYMEDQTPKND